MDLCATLALVVSLCALSGPAPAADLPHPRHRATAMRRVPRPVVAVAPSAAVPVGVAVAPEVGAARAPLPSPTAVALPGATGLPASVDLSPVFLPQRACGSGFSPDALQACRRHGELRVDCDATGRTCVPLPPDPLPYGPGAAARLAY